MQTLPMFAENIRRVRAGMKTTTLRSLKEDYAIGAILMLEGSDLCVQITKRQDISLPADLTPRIARGEGYKNVQEMIDAMNARYRGNLTPQWRLYTFAVVKPQPSKRESGSPAI